MKNFRLLLLLAALFPSMLCVAKKGEAPDTISAKRAFLEMPIGLLELISPDTRFDMLAYYENDSIYKPLNNLKGVSYLEKVTPDFVEVALTPSSTLQIKVLPLKRGDNIIMTLYSTGKEGDAVDTEIRFYDTSFRELPEEKYFRTPKLADFFEIPKGYKTSLKEIEEILPFYSFRYSASPESAVVTGMLSPGDILTVEDQKIIDMFLKPSVSFTWNGKEFKK